MSKKIRPSNWLELYIFQNYYKKGFKYNFLKQLICNYSCKISQKYDQIIVSGNYFVIISARMVSYKWKLVKPYQWFEWFLALWFESCDLKSLRTGGDSNRCEPRTAIQDIYRWVCFSWMGSGQKAWQYSVSAPLFINWRVCRAFGRAPSSKTELHVHTAVMWTFALVKLPSLLWPRLKTFISCYRTPGPQKGFRRGFWRGLWRVFEGFSKGSAKDPSKTLLKPFESPSKTLQRHLQKPLLKPFWGLGVL